MQCTCIMLGNHSGERVNIIYKKNNTKYVVANSLTSAYTCIMLVGKGLIYIKTQNM